MKIVLTLLFFLLPSLLHGTDLYPLNSGTNSSYSRIQFTEQERAWLKSNPVIELHTPDDAPPYEYVDQNGNLLGILSDYAKALEHRLGIKIRLVPHGGGAYFELLEKRDSILVGIEAFRTEETSGYLHSSRVVQGYVSLFASKEDSAPVDITTLQGASIGVISNLWNGMDFFDRLKERNRIIEKDTVAQVMKGLISGELDYVLEFEEIIKSHLRSSQMREVQKVYTLPSPIDGGFLVAESAPHLHSALNKAIADIEHNELQDILAKWYVSTVDLPLLLSEKEKSWLDVHRVIRVALDPAWAPVEYRDKNGQYAGMSLDYLKRLEKMLGIRFEVADGLSWQEAVKAVQNKQADMFASVARTPEREAYSLFTQPYTEMPVHIFARNDTSYIGGIENLTNKRVVVVKDYATHDWLNAKHPELNLVTVVTPEDGLRMVASDRADAFIGNVVTTTYYLGKLGLNSIRNSGETPFTYSQSMAVRDDWPEFADILQKALNAIPQQDHDLIYNRWMSIKFEQDIDYRLLWQVVAGAVLLILVILYWTRRLKLEVGQRKHAEDELRNYQSTLEQRVEQRTEELIASETLVRKILESTGSGVFGIDQNGIQTFVNRAGAQMLGYSVDGLIGLPSHETWHHHHTDGTPYLDHDCPIKETLKKGVERSGEEWFVRRDGSFVPVDFTSSPIIESGEVTGAVVSFMDISDKRHLESIKQSIVKGTSSIVGEAFLHELVENLAKALNMRYAFIGEVDDSLKSVSTLAVWANGKPGENFEYDLIDTPCENVAGKELCSYPGGIQALFPEDRLLVDMEAEGYAGIPLFDSNGNPLGILAVLDDKTMADETMVRSIVTLFAGRAGAELERVIAHRKLEASLEQTVRAIAHTVEQRDPYTSGHQQRVAELAVAIAQEMGLDDDQVEGIRFGSTMHDIGNIYVPTDILHRPGRLSDVEFSIIKSHTTIGYEIIKDVEFPWPVAKIILQHHERLDGTGYPNGLKDGEIILEARVVAVADVVEAINSHRPYRPSLGSDTALDEITRYRGVRYDSDVVDACMRLFNEGRFSW
ncbi:MAG: transporter substrate-binding domain-containing protein [Sedimenticola sp.]